MHKLRRQERGISQMGTLLHKLLYWGGFQNDDIMKKGLQFSKLKSTPLYP